MTNTPLGNLIELRVDNLEQLFHTLDPFPFRERDLDKEAEDFIVGWARDLAAGSTIRIVIHFPEAEGKTKAAGELSEAFRRYLRPRQRHSTRDQRAVPDRSSLARDRRHDPDRLPLVGAPRKRLPDRHSIQTSGRREFPDFLGWVANWRPLEIFLYDWLPLARRRDLYRRLAAATVELKPYPAPRPSEP